jgi:lipopolysaccharide/colanic/teichoic acid biosynthesis glycosyltransferase
LLIRLFDGDAALFRQERVGHNGRSFKTIKFRTMHPDAERLLEHRLQQDEALREEWEENFKLRNDPRITRIGRLLRMTSMDELPQLINVLKGEMSLVGPRPLPTYHYYGRSERVRILRDRVRPGMTGLWQVSVRSESGVEGMERWDTYYVRNWSIWLDVYILARTVGVVLTRNGAY